MFREEEWDDLPLVNALRADVERWRNSGYERATSVTKELLRHWAREDLLQRLFFCQREAVETIIYIVEILQGGRGPRFNPQFTHEDLAQLLDTLNAPDIPDLIRYGMQNGNRQRQNRGDGDAHRMGILQSRQSAIR